MTAPEADSQRIASRADVRVGALAVLISIAVGLVVAGAWVALAPRLQVNAVDGNLTVEAFSQAYIGTDMVFGLLAFGAGILVSVVALARWRDYPVGILLGCCIGGLAAAALAARLGSDLVGGVNGVGEIDRAGHPDGTTFDGPMRLRSMGAILLWPLAATLVISVYYAISGSRLRRRLIRAYYPAEASKKS